MTCLNNFIKNILRPKHIISVAINRGKAKNVWIELPKIGTGRSFRRIVHYPEEYTVKPLNVTNLAGRDPVSGRCVVKGIGGGIKQKFHWVDFKRIGPTEGPPLVEKVFEVMKCGCRTAFVALVGGSDKLRYIIATANMKPGDLIKTSGKIPRIPVRANEGDAHPLGALPIGTQVCSVEKFPGKGGWYANSAGTFASVVRQVDKRVIIMLPSKEEVSLLENCMAVVGRVSNAIHNKTPIGSAQANRLLGNRPRSGLWQRKTGRFGRKVRRPPPVKVVEAVQKKPPEHIQLTLKF